MTTTIRFPPSWEDQLEDKPKVKAVLADAVAETATHARGVAEQHRVTGAYADSIDHDERSLWTTSPIGHILEWGSVRTRPIAALRRGAEAAGLTVIDPGPS